MSTAESLRGGKILFIDTETTGLDSVKHRLLTVGGVILEPDFTFGSEFEIAVKWPDYPYAPKAMEMNRIDLAKHDKIAKPPEVVNTHLLEFIETHRLDGTRLGGHNLEGFDLPFVSQVSPDFAGRFSYRRVDTAKSGQLFFDARVFKNNGLDEQARFFGVLRGAATDVPHTALADAKISAGVYREQVLWVSSRK